MTFYLPETLDLDEHLQKNPASFKPFKKDKLAYLLHLINAIVASNKNIETPFGFVPLYSKAMQDVVKNYRDYLDYAVKTYILYPNSSYIAGEYSKSYQFCEAHRGELVPYTPSDFSLIQNLQRFRKKQQLTVKNHTHLTKWFNPKLEIDIKKITAFLEEERILKEHNESLLDWNLSQKKYKSPYQQFVSSELSADFIARGAYNLKVDANVHRFHSNLTNMRGMVRNAITYGGQKLVAVDIKNSQPYFSLLLLQENFWKSINKPKSRPFLELVIDEDELSIQKDDQGKAFSSFKSNKRLLYKDIQGKLPAQRIIMLGETMVSLIDKGLGVDKDLYKDLVVRGVLYDYLEDQFRTQLGMQNVNRSTAKIAVLQTLFSGNQFIGNEDAKPKKLFSVLFPSVYEVFKTIKRKEKNLLALLLQNIESHFVIEVIARRIAKEHPHLPIFTIHDSIVTTVGNVAIVEAIMKEELTQGVGFAPSLKLEYWEPATIDAKLLQMKKEVGMWSA